MPRDGSRQQGRAAAGQKAEAKVVRTKRRHDFEDPLRARDAFGSRLVDAGRPGRVQMNGARRHHAIGRHVDPAVDVLLGQQLLRRARFPAQPPSPQTPFPRRRSRCGARPRRSKIVVADRRMRRPIDVYVLWRSSRSGNTARTPAHQMRSASARSWAEVRTMHRQSIARAAAPNNERRAEFGNAGPGSPVGRRQPFHARAASERTITPSTQAVAQP